MDRETIPVTQAKDLEMAYADIVANDRSLRLFNGRGAVSAWDGTVTGLRTLQFPPLHLDGYRFSLAFRHRATGALIQDLMADMADYKVCTGGPDGMGDHPLGANWESFTPGARPGYDPDRPGYQLLVFRDGWWQPNRYRRQGHYHKELAGTWISFEVETDASVSGERDEFFMAVTLTNRRMEPLELTAVPVQDMDDPLRLNGKLPVSRPDWASMDHPVGEGKTVRFRAQADLAQEDGEGWLVTVPGGGRCRFHIAVTIDAGVETPRYDQDVSRRMRQAQQASDASLARLYGNLPRVETGVALLDAYYRRSILNVWECTWRREDYFLDPFYTCGTWMYTLAWDTSFSAMLMALSDPAGLKKTILAYIDAGVLRHSYLSWSGGSAPKAYLQTMFAAVKCVRDYMDVTNDREILATPLSGGTLLAMLKDAFRQTLARFQQGDGLMDFGGASDQIIEVRTDGYKHKVSGVNGITAYYLYQVGKWCRDTGDQEGEELIDQAKRLAAAVTDKLWDEEKGWFFCLYPDGSRHYVYAYHLYDFIRSPLLPQHQRECMIAHLREGEFLGRYGMYSIAKSDREHYDFHDADWGGGGQYIGMPNQIAQDLYALGHGEEAWEILSRTMQWAQGYPYFPQEVYTEKLGHPYQYEMPLEIAGGSGAQAIIFGVFGVKPDLQGNLVISPLRQPQLYGARMQEFCFNGHRYDVGLTETGFTVRRDAGDTRLFPYGEKACYR